MTSCQLPDALLVKLENVLSRLEATLPVPPPAPDWANAVAFRWCNPLRLPGRGFLESILDLPRIRLADLAHIDDQKRRVLDNTRHFISGYPANNVLLTGARGTGKSSLIKALLNEFSSQGLRLVEVDKGDLNDLPEIAKTLRNRPAHFIIFCDDLSFDVGDAGYHRLKSLLDGSLTTADNLLIYATANRRHLLPEHFSDNAPTLSAEGEIHPGEAVEDKIALSERFGLWVSFYPFSQAAYLAMAAHWLQHFGVPYSKKKTEREALNWALMRGARSGRIAWQYARDAAGRYFSK